MDLMEKKSSHNTLWGKIFMVKVNKLETHYT